MCVAAVEGLPSIVSEISEVLTLALHLSKEPVGWAGVENQSKLSPRHVLSGEGLHSEVKRESLSERRAALCRRQVAVGAADASREAPCHASRLARNAHGPSLTSSGCSSPRADAEKGCTGATAKIC